ncbi:MAG: DUF5652 family protein [Candidatus Staskawiczbacteria bacterium]|jgi:methionyl-tRNA synthetase
MIVTQKELQLIQLAHLLNNPVYAVLFGVLMIWSLVWKGFALWKSARNSQSVWYVVMLVVNTVGILEIIYILFFANKKENKNA